MRAIDIGDLVSGLLTLIFLSMTCGQYEKLHTFSKWQAIKALKGWPAQPPFFSTRSK